MTTSVSLPLNRYITANPAEIAQNKYAQQTSKERYAYITMVAFVALAAVANYFLKPLMLPLTFVYVNFGVLSLARNFVIPHVLEWFAEAKKLKAQGDRETKIDEKLQEIRTMRYADVTDLYRKHDMNTQCLSLDRQTATEYPLLARICYWSDLSKELNFNKTLFLVENKCREAFEAGLLSAKAKLKAAYYATLLSQPQYQGKFKDMVDWIDRGLEQQALEFTTTRYNRGVVVLIKGDHPKMISIDKISQKSIGRLAEMLLQNQEGSTSSESDSDSDSSTVY